jgi:hypothetical protein
MRDHFPDDPDLVDGLVTAEGRIEHTGAGWYTVDTGEGEPVRIRGRDAALEAAASAEDAAAPAPQAETVETFRGPCRQIKVRNAPVASTVVVERDGVAVPVVVDGRTIERTRGHFGRGRWTVTYRTD